MSAHDAALAAGDAAALAALRAHGLPESLWYDVPPADLSPELESALNEACAAAEDAARRVRLT